MSQAVSTRLWQDDRYRWILATVSVFVASGFVALWRWDFGALLAAAMVGVLVLKWILAKPVRGVYLLAAVLPLERLPTIDVAGVTIRLSLIVLVLTTIAWFVSLVTKRITIRRPQWIWLPVIAFVGVMILGSLWAANPLRSQQIIFFTVTTMWYAWIITQLLRTKEEMTMTARVLIWSAIIVSAYGIYQFIGDFVGLPNHITGMAANYSIVGNDGTFPRLVSTTAEPQFFSNFSLLSIGILLSAILLRWNQLSLWLTIPALIIIASAVGLSTSRGGFVAIAAMVVMIGLMSLRRVFSLRTIGIVACVAVVLGGGVLLWSRSNPRLASLLGTLTSFVTDVDTTVRSVSFQDRQRTADVALAQFHRSPWLGEGPGSFGPAYAVFPLREPTDGWKIVNNEYLELLAEQGIIGFGLMMLFWLGLIIAGIRAYIKSEGTLKVLLLADVGIFVGMVVQYFFFSTLYLFQLWFVIALLISHTLYALAARRSAQ